MHDCDEALLLTSLASTDASKAPELSIFNSLTDSKRTFVPKNGNAVKWCLAKPPFRPCDESEPSEIYLNSSLSSLRYTCGPTVYDLCHLGHARAYLTFDIIRRIMEDYFHYDGASYHCRGDSHRRAAESIGNPAELFFLRSLF